ncbi:MAG: diaminopimelate epimerase [bacterium]
MILPFTKMSGAGNDFIFIGPDQFFIISRAEIIAKRLCRRRKSIGADGLVIVERGRQLRMHYYNSDGSRADFCGNAARCFIIYCIAKGIAAGKVEFHSDSGCHVGMVTSRGARVSIQIPRIIAEVDIETEYGKFPIHQIDAGVPHAVVLVENVSKANVTEIGKTIRYHPWFSPSGTNVDFVQVMGRCRARIRTYERGVEDETLACGSGCAASGILISEINGVDKVELEVASGDVLSVEIDKSDNLLYLEGSADIVYEGQINLEE